MPRNRQEADLFFCSVTPLQNVRNENLLPWHRRSSYEPDAPARGVPQSPRWRVGLVCAKDAKLSCRGNRGSGGECVRSLPAVVAYPLPGGLGVGFPRTRFASRPQPKPRASCQNSRTLLAVPGYRTRSRRGLMPDKQENNRARGGERGGRRIEVTNQPQNRQRTRLGGRLSIRGLIARWGSPSHPGGPSRRQCGGLVARLASGATILKSLVLATDEVGYAGHVARHHARNVMHEGRS